MSFHDTMPFGLSMSHINLEPKVCHTGIVVTEEWPV